MNTTDPIADMLTRIRNGITARHDSVMVPCSKIKLSIAEILKKEGYIKNFTVADGEKEKEILIDLKYGEGGKRVVTGLKRISKPGLRVYKTAADMPKVLGGMGIAIISTSKGVMTDKDARAQNAGGEVLAFVW